MGEAPLQQQVHHHHQTLIPHLPDDIAMECMLRVPYHFHSTMKSVCRSWRLFISHPFFYKQRQRYGTAEHVVFLVQPLPNPDPVFNESAFADSEKIQQRQQIQSPPLYGLSIFNITHQNWYRFSPNFGHVPMFCHCVSLPCSSKILLLGGWDPVTLDPVPDVYILDLISSRWRRAAPMAVARSFFACSVVGPSSVYVAGGHDSQKNALRSAEVYDADTDEWRMLPEMGEERDECHGVSWEGDSRFWVVSGYGTDSQGRFRSDAECYDPNDGSWSIVGDGVWPFPNTSHGGTTCAVVDDKQNDQWWWFMGGEVKKCEKKEERWEVVSTIALPSSISGTSPRVTSVGTRDGGKQQQQIFVMSSGAAGGVCRECDGEGAFILEIESNIEWKWNHMHTPPSFSAFPYSATHLVI